MVEYIKKVDNDDALYCDIWNQNIITDPSKNYDAVKAKVKKHVDAVLKRKLND